MADIGTLLFTFDEDGTISLVLRGPKVEIVKKPKIELQPAIGVSRDKQGRLHFLVGNQDKVVDPVHVGEDLRKLIDSPPTSSKAALKMPSCRDLKNGKGGFKTFEEFDLNRRLWHADLPIGTRWPALTPELYEALVQSYAKSGCNGSN